MENYIDYTSPVSLKEKILQAVAPIKPAVDLTGAVMPLYQVIRFANQAAERKQNVAITVEYKVDSTHFIRSTLTGIFRSGINSNKQIPFQSSDQRMLHLLKIEQILSIQLL